MKGKLSLGNGMIGDGRTKVDEGEAFTEEGDVW